MQDDKGGAHCQWVHMPRNAPPCPMLRQETDYMVNLGTEAENILTEIFLCLTQAEDTGHNLGEKYYSVTGNKTPIQG